MWGRGRGSEWGPPRGRETATAFDKQGVGHPLSGKGRGEGGRSLLTPSLRPKILNAVFAASRRFGSKFVWAVIVIKQALKMDNLTSG